MTRQELRVFLCSWQCGCGSPETAARFVYDVLATYAARKRAGDGLSLFSLDDRPALEASWEAHATALRALLPTDGIRYFVLYVLDHWELLEHGGSVDGAWLTEKGKAVVEALEREACDDLTALCQSACIHGYADDEVCQECSQLNA